MSDRKVQARSTADRDNIAVAHKLGFPSYCANALKGPQSLSFMYAQRNRCPQKPKNCSAEARAAAGGVTCSCHCRAVCTHAPAPLVAYWQIILRSDPKMASCGAGIGRGHGTGPALSPGRVGVRTSTAIEGHRWSIELGTNPVRRPRVVPRGKAGAARTGHGCGTLPVPCPRVGPQP